MRGEMSGEWESGEKSEMRNSDEILSETPCNSVVKNSKSEQKFIT